MDRTFKVPDFTSEADEARWWFENQDRLVGQFEKAAANGDLGRGTVARRADPLATTVRLEAEDITKARSLAERRGMEYQKFLASLIHDALLKEEKVSS